ncbi:MAG TPA: ABC transporter ATP-binding protein [Flavobacteriales bacterium]|nr:ABC transporter ATP-binding protein [Flavobacteriales bacterium]
MSSEVVIKVEHLTKKYRLGVLTADTLVEDLKLWYRSRFGKKNHQPASNDASRIDSDGLFLALNNVDFSVNQGEILGIIGKNGAGKSTLLKILARVTAPTHGCVKIKGRIASLLEVGTGFHPELTGRENIFLNGAILGMTRQEITGKLDEIIDFSGIENHMDTPVKRYSSGMKVRLGFAVAAHLEPEILIVDEVLAVGDMEFQKKCLGKMQGISKTGRTILFVSHNMTAVRNLCTNAILLNDGKLVFRGGTDEAVSGYLGGAMGNRVHFRFDEQNSIGVDALKITEIRVYASGKKIGDPILMQDKIVIQILHERMPSPQRYDISLQFKGEAGEILFSNGSGRMETPGYKQGKGLLEAIVPGNLLNSGIFEVNVMVVENRRNIVHRADSLISFTVVQNQSDTGAWQGRARGDMNPVLEWTYRSE